MSNNAASQLLRHISIEFPPGPLSVGEEHIERTDDIKFETGSLKVISPTDCVKDRLAAYYHWGDKQALEQAIMVAGENNVNIREIEKWSDREGRSGEFKEIKSLLKK